MGSLNRNTLTTRESLRKIPPEQLSKTLKRLGGASLAVLILGVAAFSNNWGDIDWSDSAGTDRSAPGDDLFRTTVRPDISSIDVTGGTEFLPEPVDLGDNAGNALATSERPLKVELRHNARYSPDFENGGQYGIHVADIRSADASDQALVNLLRQDTDGVVWVNGKHAAITLGKPRKQ